MRLKTLLTIYFSALAADCAAVAAGNFALELLAKPLLMPILIVYFAHASKNLNPLKNLILAALFFSWLGDVLLLFDKRYGDFFVFGLVAFLLAHIFYIFYFWQIGKPNAAEKFSKPFALFGVFAYFAAFYALLFPHLGAMKIPILIYSVVISLMLLSSLRAFDLKRQNFGKICVLGTALFTASDSILAINRFVAPFALAPVLVMLTYALAQLLIAEGSLRNLKSAANKNEKYSHELHE